MKTTNQPIFSEGDTVTRYFSHQGELVKSIRAKHNLTQAEMGERLGIHHQYISNVERGLCGLPRDVQPIFVKEFKISKIKFRNALLSDSMIEVQHFCDQIFGNRRTAH